jgi:two-component system sensor histidine kinase YesM
MFRSLRSLPEAVRSRFAARLFLIVAAAVVLPAAILFLAGLALFESAVRESVKSELGSSLDRTERDLTSLLADLVAVSGAAANDENIRAALASGRREFEDSRLVDRSFDTILAALPGRESVRYTLVGKDRIYSSWSRNFHDYGFLRGIPIAQAAVRSEGHVVWAGFSPSFVREEADRSFLVSLARVVPAEPASASGLLILQADSDAFRRYFRDRRASQSFATLLVARGAVVMDASTTPVPKAAAASLAALAAGPSGAGAQGADFAARIGGYFAAGRRLTGLPEGLRDQDWSIAVLYDYRELDRRFAGLRALFLPSFAVLLVSALVASFFASRRVVSPLAGLSARMEAWMPEAPGPAPEEAAAQQRATEASGRQDEIGALARSFDRMRAKVGELFASLQREHEVKELFRYRALRAQLNPHFLFNSLASIRWMAIIRKADNIVEALDELSGLLSYGMGKGGDRSSLGDEIDSARRYLSIQNLRYGGRFSLREELGPGLKQAEVLRFMLQPLVENCVIHGYRGLSREGIVEVSGRLEGGTLVVEVADRGEGPLARTPGSGERPSEAGLGLTNVRDMLAIVYGPGSSLELCARDGGGSVAVARLPFVRSRVPAEAGAGQGSRP